jgi:hypothetical protein
MADIVEIPSGVFNHSFQQGTSMGLYTLKLKEDHTFELIVQTLADSPEDMDWRTEWVGVNGTVAMSQETPGELVFTPTAARHSIKSSGWSGRGEVDKDEQPFRGVLNSADSIDVLFKGKLPVTRSASGKAIATRALIFPDYIFG